ncbi:hypothetical protein [Burkholderia cepacia]|uniref:hypothetical protein n=1 Tax=Burkholderia cepacia TaxID=292 RepID=UPI002ABD5073|nr:hypothetical protein [Burkholderia cepacia]
MHARKPIQGIVLKIFEIYFCSFDGAHFKFFSSEKCKRLPIKIKREILNFLCFEWWPAFKATSLFAKIFFLANLLVPPAKFPGGRPKREIIPPVARYTYSCPFRGAAA